MIEFQTAWGWQAAVYLFLGGLGAGAFFVAGALHFTRGRGLRRTVAAAFWLAAACLAAGLLVLLSELLQPERAFLMWRSFGNGSSWMARGAWIVLAALVAFACAAWLNTRGTAMLAAGAWSERPGLRARLRDASVALGMALALGVALYTGLLLKSAEGVPFWGSWLLPALFASAALGAGANAVALVAVVAGEACKVPQRIRRAASVVVMGVLLVEVVLLALFLEGALRGGAGEFASQASAAAFSAEALVSGVYSRPFWILAFGCGLAAPLLLSAVGLFLEGRAYATILVLCAFSALAGECALRFLILFAGAHVDYVGSALVLLF